MFARFEPRAKLFCKDTNADVPSLFLSFGDRLAFDSCVCLDQLEPSRSAQSQGPRPQEMGKVKTIVQGRTKQDRKASRKALGPLRSLTVKPKTRARYESALRQFYLFTKLQRRHVPDEPSALDSLFSDYIEFLWEEGESLSCVIDGLSGLQI